MVGVVRELTTVARTMWAATVGAKHSGSNPVLELTTVAIPMCAATVGVKH